MPPTAAINAGVADRPRSFVHPITLSLSKLSLLQRMASNDTNGKRKSEEEAESLTARKRLWLSNNDGGDDDSSNSPEEETIEEEEVSSEESSMNQLNTSDEKLSTKRGHGMVFSDDGDTIAPSLKPRILERHMRSNLDISDDDDFWIYLVIVVVSNS
jgi:hypothetical protein